MISSVVMPWPSFSPKVRLRDSGEEQVATRSPSPARPISVSGSASERHRQPGGLGEAAGDHRGRGVVAEAEPDRHADREGDDVLVGAAELAADARRCWCRAGTPASARAAAAACATASSAQATTDAAGSRWAISWARLGPLTTAIRSGPAPVTSAITSLIRFRVPSSTPFISETSTASRGMYGAHSLEVRAEASATAPRTPRPRRRRAPRSVSWVAVTVGGSSMPGR